MKDIYKKSAEPLDLSEADNPFHSPYTLDLSPQNHKPAPKQTNFYEYMPLAMQNARDLPEREDNNARADDEFGDKLQYWYESGVTGLKTAYVKVAVQVSQAIKPLRLYWAVVVGAGLILGLLIISYIATHRHWITSFPTGTQSKVPASVQGDKPQTPAQSPGKGSAGSPQTPSPAAAAAPNAVGGGGTIGGSGGTTVNVPGSGGTGRPLPAAGGMPSATTSGGSTYYAPSSSSTSNTVVQPAPVPAPLPVSAPVPAPAPAPAPIIPAPVNGILAPVKSLL